MKTGQEMKIYSLFLTNYLEFWALIIQYFWKGKFDAFYRMQVMRLDLPP